jgi:hypothetical protein
MVEILTFSVEAQYTHTHTHTLQLHTLAINTKTIRLQALSKLNKTVYGVARN